MGVVDFNLYPHEQLKLDFEAILQEAKRQEVIDSRNKGEYDVASNTYNFFNRIVIPSIITNKWVYEASLIFVEKYVRNYFNVMRLRTEQTFLYQKKLHCLKKEIIDCLEKLKTGNKVKDKTDINLKKPSDFYGLIMSERLSSKEIELVDDLYRRAIDHEEMQLTLTLESISNTYEIGFPRIMFVAR